MSIRIVPCWISRWGFQVVDESVRCKDTDLCALGMHWFTCDNSHPYGSTNGPVKPLTMLFNCYCFCVSQLIKWNANTKKHCRWGLQRQGKGYWWSLQRRSPLWGQILGWCSERGLKLECRHCMYGTLEQWSHLCVYQKYVHFFFTIVPNGCSCRLRCVWCALIICFSWIDVLMELLLFCFPQLLVPAE